MMKKALKRITALGVCLCIMVALSGCLSLSGNVRTISSHSDTSEVTIDQAKDIAAGQVEGASHRDVVSIEEGREEGYLIYCGRLCHDGTAYDFKIDMASGNIVSWMVEKE